MARSITSATIYICRISILIFATIVYLYLPGLRDFLGTGITYLREHNFEGMRELILAYGYWAPIVSIGFMVIQSLVPFIPGIVITMMNAWIFGWQYGALYSWIGALLGAILDFSLARGYGCFIVEWFVNIKYVGMIDTFIQRYGVVAIFFTRLTPIIPFKVVSYGAGLTTMPLWKFVIATGIGQAPGTILYSVLGQNITHNICITIAVTSLLISICAIIYYYRNEIKQHFFSVKNN